MASSAATPLLSETVKNATIEVRRGFVRKVYGILSAQLLLTVAIATPICMAGDEWIASPTAACLLIVSTAVLLITMCAMCCFQEALRQYPTNYIFLFFITSAMGVLVGFSSAAYTWQSVLLAAGITVAIFLAMTVYAWTTTTDFSGAGPYLFAALMCLSMFGFVIMIMSMCGVNVDGAMMFYDLLGVLLFTFYIVYDTQLMIGALGNARTHKVEFSIDEYAFAALNLYLDIINLFLYLLSLLGERK